MSRHALALALLFSVSAPASAGDWDGVEAYLQAHSGEARPGFVVLVASGGETVFTRSVGETAPGSGVALGVDTPFYIASLAKPLTAIAVMELVAEGRLSLDGSVGTYLPGAPGYLKPVTIHQLLTHTGGVPDYGDDFAASHDCLDNDDVLGWLGSRDELLFEPGTEVAYSNAAYVLLARIVSTVTGKPFDEVLEERVLEPAGMAHASIARADGPMPEGRAVGYARDDDGKWVKADYDRCTLGPGGVFASASDLLALDRALRDGRLLDENARAAMFEPATLAGGEPAAFGSGWISGTINRGPLKGLDVTQALGNLNGYGAAMRRFTKDRVTVIWLSNSGQPLFDAGIEDAAVKAGLLHPPAPADEDRSSRPLSDELVAEIRRGPERVVVPAGSATVPVVGSRTLPLLETRIEGHGPYGLLLDLGSNVSILRKSIAEAAGARLLVDRDTSDIYRAGLSELGPVRLENVVYGAYEDLDVDGVLGFNAFDDQPFTLDYPGMCFTVGGEPLPPPTEDSRVFAYELKHHMPFLAARLGDRELSLNFDTGAFGWIVLPASMKSELSLAAAPVPGFKVFNNQTGSARVELARLNGTLEFGPLRLPEPMVQFDPDVEEPFVGSSLLARLRLSFDPANRRVRMQPVGGTIVHVPGFATFGVKLKRQENEVTVADVIPGTPAASMDIPPNAVVGSINGRPASGYGADALSDINQARGDSRLDLALQSDDGTRRVTLERAVLAAPKAGVEPDRVEDVPDVPCRP